MYFDALCEQARHELRDPRGIALIARDQERERRFLEAPAPGVQSLLIEMAQQRLRLLRGEVECGERRRLGVIEVIPRRPAEGAARRRRWPVPFPAHLVRVGV